MHADYICDECDEPTTIDMMVQVDGGQLCIRCAREQGDN